MQPYDPELDPLAEAAIKACQAYFDEWKRRGLTDAVIWFQKETTGQMICFTPGEYGEQLQEFIKNLGNG